MDERSLWGIVRLKLVLFDVEELLIYEHMGVWVVRHLGLTMWSHKLAIWSRRVGLVRIIISLVLVYWLVIIDMNWSL